MARRGAGLACFGSRPEKKALRMEELNESAPLPATPTNSSSEATTSSSTTGSAVENIPPPDLGDKRTRGQRRQSAVATSKGTPMAPTPQSTWRTDGAGSDMFAASPAPAIHGIFATLRPGAVGGRGIEDDVPGEDSLLDFPPASAEAGSGATAGASEVAPLALPVQGDRSPPPEGSPPSPAPELHIATGHGEPAAEDALSEPPLALLLASPGDLSIGLDSPAAEGGPDSSAPAALAAAPEAADGGPGVVADAPASAQPAPPPQQSPTPELQPHSLQADASISRNAAAACWLGSGAHASLPGTPAAGLLAPFPPDGLMKDADAFLEALSKPGTAGACGLLTDGASEDAALLALVLQVRDGTTIFAPPGVSDGRTRAAGRTCYSYSHAAAVRFTFASTAAACPVLEAKTALQPDNVAAALRSAGLLPVVMEAQPFRLEVAPSAVVLTLAEEASTLLQQLGGCVLMARSSKVGLGIKEADARKAAQLQARVAVRLQVLGGVVVLCTLAGKAREAVGLPARPKEAAVRAVAALIPRDADASQWVAALLPGGVALPMPAQLHDALFVLLQQHAQEHQQPTAAPTGATGLGLEHWGLGDRE
ncbi:hypothetical protein Rsub_11513 [Raphidocelis subcapitata]|uniref:Uncharacterized protein n=1 Tax=Raphidocelis subcapitata TaxID=307507 RepID=A0A2V0PHM0_9CHLO|nr:hypothetical protein Rsub_11513 [Raphidocelis subcapitata]|eukprot:GBF98522.1 hypothetical protein Rsub_11513 [Raphidocelis subcapitata]